MFFELKELACASQRDRFQVHNPHENDATIILRIMDQNEENELAAWIASDEVQVVLITGGTGLTEGDQAPEALLPLFDREVEGFG
ncbi:molybdopterin-binding protein, partial [Salmonella enterica subsp. enterica serovar Anatum]|nr:molybdopterin-binding protein [Salmonella enterica subsp. enterica serovar Anatum]